MVLLGLIAGAQAQVTTRASVADNEAQGNGDSPDVGARISGNGQYVAFRSVATNLVGLGVDTNGYSDVFVRDLIGGTTTRVSVADGIFGAQAVGGDSNNPSISADGRFVAFTSHATNLVAGDTNGKSDVFVRDTVLETTTRVSVAWDGVEGNFESDSSAISADGQIIAFRSLATNLVPGDTNAYSDVFVRAAGTTTLVSVATDGLSGGNGQSGLTQTAVSADGSTVGFSSSASNLVASDTNGAVSDVFIRKNNATTLISKTTTGLQGQSGSYSVALSTDGSIAAFTSYNNMVNGDTNGELDVFVRDTNNTGTTTRVSIASGANGAQGNRASGNSNGWGIAISGDGTKVAFQSLATNLVKKDTNGFEDIFLRNRSTNSTTMVSVTPSGGLANGSSGGLNTCGVSMSADGVSVMFCSYATNLVTGDTNGFMDVFVRK